MGLKKAGEAEQVPPDSEPQHHYFRRIAHLLLWLAVFASLSAVSIVFFAVFTPLPDALGEKLLYGQVARAGGTLSIGEKSGSLVRGLELKDIRLEIPGKLTVKIDRISVKLSAVPLAAGIIRLKYFTVSNPDVTVIQTGKVVSPEKPYRNPPWLNLWVSDLEVRSGNLRLTGPSGEGSNWYSTFSKISASGHLYVRGQEIRSDLEQTEAFLPPPYARMISALGSVRFRLGGRGQCMLTLASGFSRGKLQMDWKTRAGQIDSFEGEINVRGIRLADFGDETVYDPPISFGGSLDVHGGPNSAEWDGSVNINGQWTGDSKGEVRWSEGKVILSGTVDTKKMALPFIPGFSGIKVPVISGKCRGGVRFRPSSGLTWDVHGDLGATTIWGYQLNSATADVSGNDESVKIKCAVAGPEAGRADVDIRIGVADDRWKVGAVGTGVAVIEVLGREGLVPQILNELKIPAGRWELGSLEIGDEGAGLFVKASATDPTGSAIALNVGPTAEKGPVTWDVEVGRFDPSRWGLGPAGEWNGSADFRGSAGDRGELAIEAAKCRWANVDISPFNAALTVAPEGVRLGQTTVKTSVGSWSGRAFFSKDGDVDADVDIDVDDIACLGEWVGDKNLQGRLSLKAKVSGPMKRPAVKGRADAEDIRIAGVECARLSAEGTLDPVGGETDLDLSWDGLTPEGGSPITGSCSLSGSKAGVNVALKMECASTWKLSLSASGPANPDGGRLVVKGLVLDLNGRKFSQEGEALFAWKEKVVSAENLRLANGSSQMALGCSADFSRGTSDAPISGSLYADGMPLSMLRIPEEAGRIRGLVGADLRWRGTVASPKITGEASIQDASYKFSGSDMVIKPISVKMKADGDRLNIVEASATTPEGGAATCTGHVGFTGFLPTEFKLNLTGKGFPLLIGKDIHGLCDFAISLSGSPAQPKLSGTAKVLKGKIQLADLSRQQPLPPSIRFVGENREKMASAPKKELGANLGKIHGKLRLECDGKLWVSNKNLIAELGGALIITLAPDGIEVTGTAELLQGRYIFQGRKFDLLESKLSFGGGKDLSPYLSVNAVNHAQGADVFIHLSGKPEMPDLQLSSSPPMEKGDILSTLFYGRPARDLSESQKQSSAAAAAAIASQYQAIPLVDSLKEQFKLATLQVGTTVGGTEVGFSKYMGDKTVIEYRQIFGSLPEQRLDFRYKINRRWSFQAEYSTIDDSGADVLWEKSY